MEPAFFFCCGDEVGFHFFGGGVFTSGKYGGVRKRKLYSFGEIAKLFEVCFRFSGESDDDVGGDGTVGDAFSYFFNNGFVLFDGVVSVHSLKYFVGSVLGWKVYVGTGGGEFGEGVDNFVGEVLWVWGGEA